MARTFADIAMVLTLDEARRGNTREWDRFAAMTPEEWIAWLTVETKGERRACLQFRKWLGRYAKRIPRLRAHIELARTLSAAAQLEEVL